MKLSTIYGILTLVFALLGVAGIAYVFRTGGAASTFWGIAPIALALVFSNLMVRARNEGK